MFVPCAIDVIKNIPFVGEFSLKIPQEARHIHGCENKEIIGFGSETELVTTLS